MDVGRINDLLPKAKNIGTGVAAGGSTLLLVMNMFGAKLDDLNKKIDDKNQEVRHYVDFQHGATTREMKFLHEGQNEIKDMLRTIDGRLYNSTRKNTRGVY